MTGDYLPNQRQAATLETMNRNKTSHGVPVKGTTKHMKNAKRHMTVRDVIERCIRTGEPIPEYYRERDPHEIIAEIQDE